MKKVLIITNLPTPYKVDFYSELGKYCDLTVIFEGKRPTDLVFNWNDDDITTFKPIYLSYILNEKKIHKNILKYFDNNKYDTIVLSCYYTYTQTFALLYMKLKGVKYYFETDGGMISYGENNIIRLAKRFLIGGAKAYFSPSQVSDEYLIYYNASPNLIFRYPFTSLDSSDILKEPLTTPEKKRLKDAHHIKYDKIIISIGQFIHRKGFDVLLESCKLIDKSVGIYVMGGSPTKQYLDIQKKLSLTNVHFVPFKSNKEVKEWLKMSNLFVLPTREDIWGLVINEAMANGLPVVTTDKCVAGIELIEDKECIVAVEDVDALYNIMNKIISDDEYSAKLSENNLIKIRDSNFQNMAQSHLQVFNIK